MAAVNNRVTVYLPRESAICAAAKFGKVAQRQVSLSLRASFVVKSGHFPENPLQALDNVNVGDWKGETRETRENKIPVPVYLITNVGHPPNDSYVRFSGCG